MVFFHPYKITVYVYIFMLKLLICAQDMFAFYFLIHSNKHCPLIVTIDMVGFICIIFFTVIDLLPLFFVHSFFSFLWFYGGFYDFSFSCFLSHQFYLFLKFFSVVDLEFAI